MSRVDFVTCETGRTLCRHRESAIVHWEERIG